MTGILITGCAQKPLPAPAAAIAPNPFGYLKQSAVCTVSPIVNGPTGRSAKMSVRSDDGLCTVALSQPDGTAYASFLLQTLPAHGKAFIYNYNNQTLVNYTATTAYAGPDNFTVSLIPTAGHARVALQVAALADATGVVLPPPPPAPSVAAPSKSSHRSSKSTHSTRTKHKKASSS
jgi:hypothetical protein